uniref:Uncharacterized protein n=1 Tax=Strongyloides papillosus TaxID=174720 RepID=A0A0N5BW17_STREA
MFLLLYRLFSKAWYYNDEDIVKIDTTELDVGTNHSVNDKNVEESTSSDVLDFVKNNYEKDETEEISNLNESTYIDAVEYTISNEFVEETLPDSLLSSPPRNSNIGLPLNDYSSQVSNNSIWENDSLSSDISVSDTNLSFIDDFISDYEREEKIFL